MTEEARKARNNYMRVYRENNRDKLTEYNRNWRKAHPEKIREYNAVYWSRKAAAAKAAREEQPE